MTTEAITEREGRLLRCVKMAMGCLSPLAMNRDERLAWYRLLDAVEGREPSVDLKDAMRRKKTP